MFGMSSSEFTARPYVLHEANQAQVRRLKANVALLPWGATEAHNYHLPYGTDVIQATRVGEEVVGRANALGARCLLLPTVPFGNDNVQLSQYATITMRTSTQLAVLNDVAQSLVMQGIDRLVILNGHGGNEHSPLIRDVILDHPIFIVRINYYGTAPQAREILDNREGDHANEMETSVMLHLMPQWVAPLETAGDGFQTPSKMLKLASTPEVWYPRDWAASSKDTGHGDPRKATAAKGKHIFEAVVGAITPILVELSAAQNGDFPYVIRPRP
jgi:creatinine amidohydrolase